MHTIPLIGSFAKFAWHGQSGATVSEVLPNKRTENVAKRDSHGLAMRVTGVRHYRHR